MASRPFPDRSATAETKPLSDRLRDETLSVAAGAASPTGRRGKPPGQQLLFWLVLVVGGMGFGAVINLLPEFAIVPVYILTTGVVVPTLIVRLGFEPLVGPVLAFVPAVTVGFSAYFLIFFPPSWRASVVPVAGRLLVLTLLFVAVICVVVFTTRRVVGESDDGIEYARRHDV